MKKYFLFFGLSFFILACNKKQAVYKITAKTIEVDSLQKTDSTYYKTYLPYKKELAKKIKEKLSYTKTKMVRDDGVMQSTLGNFLADVCFDKANEIFKAETQKSTDFSFFNYGGIRAGISPGNITFENAFKLMPFDNTLVVVEMKADKVEELLQYFVDRKLAHPISKQVKIVINNGKGTIKINNKPLQKDRNYYVVTSNYLQGGGDKMDFFKNPVNLYGTDFLMREAIKIGLKKNDTIVAKLDNRVIVK